MNENENIPAVEEQDFDFSGDSAVERVTGVFTITKVEPKQSSSDNGEGTYHALTFEGESIPFPITLRLFIDYTSHEGKSTDWVKRQRGILKNIAKAAVGQPSYSLNPSSENYIVGRRVTATTRDDGEGRPTLGRFKAVKE